MMTAAHRNCSNVFAATRRERQDIIREKMRSFRTQSILRRQALVGMLLLTDSSLFRDQACPEAAPPTPLSQKIPGESKKN
jgi:hypothetical protein